MGAIGAASTSGNKELANKVLETWNKLVELTYGGDVSNEAMDEKAMQKEYAEFRNVNAGFKIDKKSGKVTVTGLEKFIKTDQ